MKCTRTTIVLLATVLSATGAYSQTPNGAPEREKCRHPSLVRLVPPKILEPVRRQRHRGAGDRLMPEPSLDRSGVIAFVGERIAASVAWRAHSRERGAACVGAL
jgi:hypothetical protein